MTQPPPLTDREREMLVLLIALVEYLDDASPSGRDPIWDVIGKARAAIARATEGRS